MKALLKKVNSALKEDEISSDQADKVRGGENIALMNRRIVRTKCRKPNVKTTGSY